jgi:hypothetical protein
MASAQTQELVCAATAKLMTCVSCRAPPLETAKCLSARDPAAWSRGVQRPRFDWRSERKNRANASSSMVGKSD